MFEYSLRGQSGYYLEKTKKKYLSGYSLRGQSGYYLEKTKKKYLSGLFLEGPGWSVSLRRLSRRDLVLKSSQVRIVSHSRGPASADVTIAN